VKIYELIETIKWAIDDNIDKATLVTQRDISKPNNIIIWVNIRKLFDNTEDWQKLDINDITGGKNHIGNRIQQAKKYWSDKNYMDPPIITYNDYTKKINFTDGRHRLAAAYQLGQKWAPVITDKKSAKIIKKLIGAK